MLKGFHCAYGVTLLNQTHLGSKKRFSLEKNPDSRGSICTANRVELENISSLERVPDYRGFSLERFHCVLNFHKTTTSLQMANTYTVDIDCSQYEYLAVL
jgi:hypothetical protein